MQVCYSVLTKTSCHKLWIVLIWLLSHTIFVYSFNEKYENVMELNNYRLELHWGNILFDLLLMYTLDLETQILQPTRTKVSFHNRQ